MDLLVTLCRNVSENWVWVDEIIISTNLCLAYIEAQGVSRFPECKEHVQAAVEQIKVVDVSVKNLQQ